MIVTFDTSIVVRATKRSDGPARKVVNAFALNPDHVIALSPFILGEVRKVLSYPRLRSVARIVEPQRGLPVVLSDPKGDPFVHRRCRRRRCLVRQGPTLLRSLANPWSVTHLALPGPH